MQTSLSERVTPARLPEGQALWETIQVLEKESHLEIRFPTLALRERVGRWFSADDPDAEYYGARGWLPPEPYQFCAPVALPDELVCKLPLGFKQRLQAQAENAGLALAWKGSTQPSVAAVPFDNLLLNYDDGTAISFDPVQSRACKALLSRDRCALELPCGGGKTEVVLNAWACLSRDGAVGNALFVVPNKSLLAQTWSRVQKRSPWAGSVGKIGAGRFEPKSARNFVVATVQSACGRAGLRYEDEIQRYLQTVDLLIIDEAHRATGEQYRLLLSSCHPRWIWGLSAKFQYHAKKHALKQMTLESVFGLPVTLAASPERIAPASVVFYTDQAWRGQAVTRATVTPEGMEPCYFQRKPGGPWEDGFWPVPDRNGKLPSVCLMPDPRDILEEKPDGSPVFDRSAMVRDCDSDLPDGLKYNPANLVPDPSKIGPYVRLGSAWEQVVNPAGYLRLNEHVVTQMGFTPRNAWALDLAKEFSRRKQAFLVTVRRVPHLGILRAEFKKAGLQVRAFHGDLDEARRAKALEDLKSGQIDGLIATYSTVSEGTDLPNLVHLIKLDGITDEQVLTQQLGRVQRRVLGKKAGYIHIPVDVQAPLVAGQAEEIRDYFGTREVTIHDINVEE